MSLAQAPGHDLLPWHGSAWQGLIARWREGRLPHALLLTGPEGLGKNHFAERLSQALLCKLPQADGQACGQCRSCLLFLAGTHPDLLYVQPTEEGKAIVVDQIREATAYLTLTSQYAGIKVVILAPAELMNIAAANSLLKTLEDPLGETLLILITSKPGMLLATIRSRCQQLVFSPPPATLALPWLTARVNSEAEAAQLLALCAGAPLTALALSSSGDLEQRQTVLDGLLKLAQGRADPLTLCASWLQKGITTAHILQWTLNWTMDMIRLRTCETPPYLANMDARDALQGLAQRLTLRVLYTLFDSITEATGLLRHPLNQQLLVEDVAIKWQQSFSK